MPKIIAIIDLAKQAGTIIMNHYHSDNIEITYKADSSPVSTADLESNQLICNSLSRLYPNIPIISEENDNISGKHQLFWSIDPLDGTKSFLNRDGEFTVNIALIKDKIPILGVIYSPLSNELYYVDESKIPYKQSANKQDIAIQARPLPNEGATVLISSSSINNPKLKLYLQDKKINKIIPTSSALKICRIAEGLADLYPRFGQTMEWDTAAGHAILNAAGGSIRDLNGQTLTYGHAENQYYNPEFIVTGK